MDRQYEVLVVDDSPFIYKAVKRALEPSGYKVVDNAPNGQVGLEMFNKYKPDIVVMDVTMPIMDGITTSRTLLKDSPDARIIMLSAMGDEELINEAKDLGVKCFLSKPFKKDELLQTIQYVLGGGTQCAG